MAGLELTTLLLPTINNINILGYGTSFISIVLGIGIGLGYYRSTQDMLGIFVLTQIIFYLLGINNLWWLTILAAFIYTLMAINVEGE